MKPEGSLPCSQEPPTRPYPEPNESNPHPQTYYNQRVVIKALPPSHNYLNTKARCRHGDGFQGSNQEPSIV
jgi:hypothetical protein